jgi:glyoxylase-like metal-dependent hydrolase (beta-lactamase superfamily II)
MEIIPGIHKIDGIPGVNCYLIQISRGFILVDTGTPGLASRTLDYVKRLNKNPADIKYIILSHADIDHIGCIKKLKERTGAQVAIHPADLPILEGRQKFKTINNFLGPLVSWSMSLWRYQPCKADILLKDGLEIEGWRIVTSPGHTLGSICLFKPGQTILVGDALRTSFRGVPRAISRRICVDLDLRRRSMQKIAGLEYEVLLPGHGAPILRQASPIFQAMVERFMRSGKEGKILGIY